MNKGNNLAAYLPTSSFSAVMGMGIVSDALLQLHLYSISQLLEYSDVVVYLGLVVLFILLLVMDWNTAKKSLLNHFSVLGSFTFIAGTAVLATRLSESGLVFVDVPAMIISLIVFLLLFLILVLSVRGSVFENIKNPYLFLVPFIALLGISVLSSQTFYKLNIWYPFLFSISMITWAIGFLGTSIFIVYSFKNFGKKFFNHNEINGFYFIYSGIASLIAFSDIVMIKFYDLDSQLLVSFLTYVALLEFIWAVVFSIFLFYIYFLKLRRGSIEFRHRVTIWGSVFPMGVDAMGSYFVSLYFHIHFLIYLAYFYAFTGVFLIAIDLMEILVFTIFRRTEGE